MGFFSVTAGPLVLTLITVAVICLLTDALALVSKAAVHSNEAMRKMVINIFFKYCIFSLISLTRMMLAL